MGRLNRLPNRLRRLLTNWLAPVCLALIMIFGWHVLARAATPPTLNELAAYLQDNRLDVGSETVDGYQQVYYNYQDQKIFLTSAAYSHIHPVASGEFVAWEGRLNGAGQIFIYNVLTRALTQFTSPGTNQNPAIFENTVAWESWSQNHWQILYYDGVTVRRISKQKVTAVRPSLDGKQVIYAEQLKDKWRTVSYDVSTRKSKVVKEGDEASTAYPHFGAGGKVRTGIKP